MQMEGHRDAQVLEGMKSHCCSAYQTQNELMQKCYCFVVKEGVCPLVEKGLV